MPGRRKCCCGGGVKCSTFFCPACGEYLLIDQGTVTDDQGTHTFDATGKTAPIGDAGYWYVLDCSTHSPSITLEEHWLNDDGDEVVEGSIATPSSCDPLTSSHTFVDSGVPASAATVSIPKAAGMACAPCCVPGPDFGPLTLSFANPFPGNVCSGSSILLAAHVLGNITSWSDDTFCSAGRPGSPLSVGMFCNGGSLTMQVTNPFDVDPLSCTPTLVSCSFDGTVFHAHFHTDGCLLPTFKDFYVDS